MSILEKLKDELDNQAKIGKLSEKIDNMKYRINDILEKQISTNSDIASLKNLVIKEQSEQSSQYKIINDILEKQSNTNSDIASLKNSVSTENQKLEEILDLIKGNSLKAPDNPAASNNLVTADDVVDDASQLEMGDVNIQEHNHNEL